VIGSIANIVAECKDYFSRSSLSRFCVNCVSPLCRGTGYSGRIAIIEGYWVTDTIRHIVGHQNASSELINDQMIKQGGRSLYMQAALLAAKGVTDLPMAMQIRSDD